MLILRIKYFFLAVNVIKDATTYFDTHTSIKRLMDAGMDEAQAEAVVYVQADAINSRLATKQDVGDIRSEMSALKAELNANISNTKSEVIKWMLMAMIGQAGVILAFINFATSA